LKDKGDRMSFDDKVDVIDLIINVLREHEKSLDALVAKLEEILTSERPIPLPSTAPGPSANRVKVFLRNWSEFRDRCTEASLVAYDLAGDRFQVSALKDETLYFYSETVPDIAINLEKEGDRTLVKGVEVRSLDRGLLFDGRLRCGLTLATTRAEFELPSGTIVQKIRYDIQQDEARSWLSKQLKVNKNSIMQGRLET
jgi:hypothetical protein